MTTEVPLGERVITQLIKRMVDECGTEKVRQFIERVESGEHDVPSPWTYRTETE